MRLFISIDISEKLKREALEIQKKISLNKSVKLVPKENLHLTLKFLGEVDNVNKIIEILKTIKFKAFEIESSSLGFFPNEKFITVAWIGFKENKELFKLQKMIDDSLKDFKSNFNFHPHLTIARMKVTEENDKKNILSIKNNSSNIESIKSIISSFKLMKSTLTKNGPVYECLKEFKTSNRE